MRYNLRKFYHYLYYYLPNFANIKLVISERGKRKTQNENHIIHKFSHIHIVNIFYTHKNTFLE